MKQLRCRLDGRSRGLLELENQEAYSVHSFLNCKVTFVHHTVRDFLHNHQDVRDTFKQKLDDENVALTACSAILAVMKTSPNREVNNHTRRNYIDVLFEYVPACIPTANAENNLRVVLDEAEEVFNSNLTKCSCPKLPTLMLGLAAAVDFPAYVEYKLKTVPSLRKVESLPPQTDYYHPVLYYALHLCYGDLRAGRGWNAVSLRCVDLLLQVGADPNADANALQNSVWDQLLNQARRANVSDRDMVQKLVRLLLDHGASWEQLEHEGHLVELLGEQMWAEFRDKFAVEKKRKKRGLRMLCCFT
jgi:hypothetical protein